MNTQQKKGTFVPPCFSSTAVSGLFKRPVGLIVCFFVSLQLVGCSPAGKGHEAESAINFTTAYQAVFLDNGDVYFGKIEQPGSAYPLLRDVYFVQKQVNPETKEVNNVIVKQSDKANAPDMMYVNSRHVVIIEPVTEGSKVAQVIKGMATQKASPKP